MNGFYLIITHKGFIYIIVGMFSVDLTAIYDNKPVSGIISCIISTK